MGWQYSPLPRKIQNKSRLARYNLSTRLVDPLCKYPALPELWGDGTSERPAAKRQIWGILSKCQEEDLAISFNPQDMRWGDTEKGGEQGVGQDHNLKPPCYGKLQMQNFPSCLKGTEVSQKETSSTTPQVAWGRPPLPTLCPSCVQNSPSPPTSASFTLCSTNNEGGCRPNCKAFGEHVKEGTQNISLLNRTERFKGTELLKTKTIGWDIMEAGWEGTLCKGLLMFILFYNQDIKRHLSWALDIFARELWVDISALREEVAPKIQMRALATPYPWASSCWSSILSVLHPASSALFKDKPSWATQKKMYFHVSLFL